jgi:drug/metabolite transporter (DMT)-like permease
MTQMALVAAIILSIAAVITGGLQLPVSNVGWCAMLAAAALQAASIPLLYIAIPIIGPERSAVANNIQPVATIAVAILLVGETLQLGQFVGATMIIGGILIMQYSAQRATQK